MAKVQPSTLNLKKELPNGMVVRIYSVIHSTIPERCGTFLEIQDGKVSQRVRLVVSELFKFISKVVGYEFNHEYLNKLFYGLCGLMLETKLRSLDLPSEVLIDNIDLNNHSLYNLLELDTYLKDLLKEVK